MQLYAAATAYGLGSDPLKISMQAGASESGVVGLKHTFRISLADRRRVRVHGVQQELHRGCAAPLQVAGVVVRDYYSCFDLPLAESIAKLRHGRVVADHPKA